MSIDSRQELKEKLLSAGFTEHEILVIERLYKPYTIMTKYVYKYFTNDADVAASIGLIDFLNEWQPRDYKVLSRHDRGIEIIAEFQEDTPCQKD